MHYFSYLVKEIDNNSHWSFAHVELNPYWQVTRDPHDKDTGMFLILSDWFHVRYHSDVTVNVAAQVTRGQVICQFVSLSPSLPEELVVWGSILYCGHPSSPTDCIPVTALCSLDTSHSGTASGCWSLWCLSEAHCQMVVFQLCIKPSLSYYPP